MKLHHFSYPYQSYQFPISPTSDLADGITNLVHSTSSGLRNYTISILYLVKCRKTTRIHR